MNRIAIIGAGAWGRALAVQAARAGAAPTLVGRNSSLPDDSDAILISVPTQSLRAVLDRHRPRAPLLVCCKGIEAGTGLLPLEIVADILPGTPAAVLTGPNFAHEIAAGLPAASVVAAVDTDLRAAMIARLGSPNFRLYGNDDVIGAQLGGAAKNVIAIAAGAVIGAGYGENARAALITRGLAELSRLIASQGGRAETAAGLSGMGDLVLTCTGAGSRNFAFGAARARGEKADVSGVVEGVATAPALIARAAGVDLPICACVAAVLAGEISLPDALTRLMGRPLRNET